MPTPDPRGRLGSIPGQAADPTALYQRVGLISESGPLPFTGIVRYFGTASPDSTLVLLALSLANRSLSFVGEGNEYRATYRVTILTRGAAGLSREFDAREHVRVSAFRETTRGEESIVFQQFFTLAPGENTISLTVRDEGTPRSGSTNLTLRVPRLLPGTLSSPVLSYDAVPRHRSDSLPQIIANPRVTVVFGRDSLLRVYLEGYGLEDDSSVVLTALAERRRTPVWRDTVTLPRRDGLSSAVLVIPVSTIGAGEIVLAATRLGSTDTVSTPVFVSFGEEWALTSFEEMLGYLRYFATPEELSALRNAPPAGRAAAWAAFWRSTDPLPTTPENEALRDYFARVRIANERFSEEGGPGWLTDRGRVLLTLGDPDEIYEQQEPSVRQRNRTQVWVYNRYQVRLVFVDQTGFGRWRLTMSSEVDLQAATRERQR